jgi:ATP-dependent DNA helicase RecG
LQARRRLIFEEFFFQKLFLIDRKNKSRQTKSLRPKIPHSYQKAVIERLPFSLMPYQKDALEEIRKSMFSENVFSILLQADVGSGKTLVALLAMLDAVEAGYQAVLLVPTEVLATQHYRTIRNFTRDLWLDTALLTGNMSKKERDNILSGLKSGEIKIAVGTHALFSADVEYRNLGFAVIDEQHRFGVEQRYQLLSKGSGVDLLLMTATPIPQSLAQSLYGDLDLVTMRGKITGRLPVRTWVVEDNPERINSMHAWIKKTLAQDDGRAIFVYPLIEDTGKSDAKNLQDESQKLADIYKDEGCISIHSGTPAAEKDQIIQDFRNGKIRVLAATTVVEVGLDVPDANIIVVENADHFGLSTLHQLRGRVGRNSKQGYMILIPGARVSEQGVQRLEILRTEHDGFRIAEQDLQMRGPGDFIGNRQSGMFNIKLADIKHDMQLLLDSAKAAEHLAQEDPTMEQTQHIITRESFHLRIKNYNENITT